MFLFQILSMPLDTEFISLVNNIHKSGIPNHLYRSYLVVPANPSSDKADIVVNIWYIINNNTLVSYTKIVLFTMIAAVSVTIPQASFLIIFKLYCFFFYFANVHSWLCWSEQWHKSIVLRK